MAPCLCAPCSKATQATPNPTPASSRRSAKPTSWPWHKAPPCASERSSDSLLRFLRARVAFDSSPPPQNAFSASFSAPPRLRVKKHPSNSKRTRSHALPRKLHQNAVYFRGGVGGARDLAADYQVVGAVANRLGGRGHALLIARVHAGRTHSWRHDDRIRSNHAPHRRSLQGRRDDSIDAHLHRLARTAFHQARHRAVVAKIVQILGSETGQYGDGQNLQPAARARRHGGAHHRHHRVHRQKTYAG